MSNIFLLYEENDRHDRLRDPSLRLRVRINNVFPVFRLRQNGDFAGYEVILFLFLSLQAQDAFGDIGRKALRKSESDMNVFNVSGDIFKNEF